MDQQQPNNQTPAPAAAPAASSPATPAAGAKHSTLFIIGTYVFFFLPYFSEAKNDPFIKFHMKQSLGLLICWFAVAIIFSNILGFYAITSLLNLVLFVLWLVTVIKAAQGKQELVPLLGEHFEKYLKI